LGKPITGGPVCQDVEALAEEASDRLAASAWTFAELHARKPLFQKLMRRRGGSAVIVRFDWPGVLRVFDPATGELMAQKSAPLTGGAHE
jgi:hypothetical protein